MTTTNPPGFDLKGRRALVTGASNGIGRAIAVALAQAGADVAIHHLNDPAEAAKSAESVRHCGQRASIVTADIRNVDEIETMVQKSIEGLGGLDILINNAGVTGWNGALDVKPDLWDMVVDTNLRGTFFCATAAAKHMKENRGGAILNVSTIVSLAPMANLTVYAASKGGINVMTRQLALELAPFGIRVNAIAPGPISVARNLADDPEYDENWGRITPLGRVGQPEDLGGAAVFLCGERASWLTGQIIAIDGGISLPARVPQASLDRALQKNS